MEAPATDEWREPWRRGQDRLMDDYDDWIRDLRLRYPIERFQEGGFVQSTGPQFLHRGEMVLNASQWQPLMRLFSPGSSGALVGQSVNVDVIVQGIAQPVSVGVISPETGLSRWSMHW